MKKLAIVFCLLSYFSHSFAQIDRTLYRGVFKAKTFASSNQYKPDKWEKSYYDNSIKTAFPSDLLKQPDKYENKLIHLIGIVDSVYIDSLDNVTFRLENKYWDYIEDYSIQDEKMFISDKGDGQFLVTLSGVRPNEYEILSNFSEEKKLFLVYGTFKGIENNYPVLSAQKIKYIDYKFYTTKAFYYEIKRDENGDVVSDGKKNGKPSLSNFKIIAVPKAGQNK
jgi:hypothetical protein